MASTEVISVPKWSGCRTGSTTCWSDELASPAMSPTRDSLALCPRCGTLRRYTGYGWEHVTESDPFTSGTISCPVDPPEPGKLVLPEQDPEAIAALALSQVIGSAFEQGYLAGPIEARCRCGGVLATAAYGLRWWHKSTGTVSCEAVRAEDGGWAEPDGWAEGPCASPLTLSTVGHGAI